MKTDGKIPEPVQDCVLSEQVGEGRMVNDLNGKAAEQKEQIYCSLWFQ